jgi:hypothetical protein
MGIYQGSKEIAGKAGVNYSALITSSQTWTAPYTGRYKATLVGGGGGGGSPHFFNLYGGGGGAGGVIITTFIIDKNTQIPATVGAGGAGAKAEQNSVGSSGGTSSINGFSVSGGGGGMTPKNNGDGSYTATGGKGGNNLSVSGSAGGDNITSINPVYAGIGGKNAILADYGCGGTSPNLTNAIGNPGVAGCVLIEYLGE